MEDFPQEQTGLNAPAGFVPLAITLIVIAVSLAVMTIRSRGKVGLPDERVGGEALVSRPHLLIICLYGLIVAGYFVLRYDGHWTENDTAAFTRAIEVIRDQGTILPTGMVYQHGFGYQVISLALLSTTGLSPQALQTVIFPYVAAIGLILTSLVFFREALQDWETAILASFFLLLQPDVVFVTLRGSHEKVIWPLMMIALMLFYRSIGRPAKAMALHAGLFYVTVFAMITTNVFFSSVFLVAVACSVVLGLVLNLFVRRHKPLPRSDLGRLMFVSASNVVLTFLVMAYVYPLALLNFRTLRTILDQMSALLLSFEIKSQPYAYITFGWTSPGVYLALTTFTWLLIGASLMEWLRRGWGILRGREELGLAASLDWLLYAGFALQIGISIMVDFSGALAANLQLRLFPGFTVMAAVLVARGLRRVLSLHRFAGRVRLVAFGLSGLAVAWFALASVLKATNEPALSNKWSFWSPSEDAAIRWSEGHMVMESIWSGTDERLEALVRFKYRAGSQTGNVYDFYEIDADDRYVLFSEVERMRASRVGMAMPSVLEWSRIYDNGETYLYWRDPILSSPER